MRTNIVIDDNLMKNALKASRLPTKKAAVVENFTDQKYTVDVFNLARLRRAILHAVGDPRTYGVTFRVNF